MVSGDLRETGVEVAVLRATTVLSGGYEEGWVQVRAGAWNMRAVGTVAWSFLISSGALKTFKKSSFVVACHALTVVIL